MSFTKKYLLTLATVILIVILGRKSTATSTSAQNSVSSESSQPSATTAQLSANWHDGTYTGNLIDAYYGNVQVQAVISNQKISKVNVLSFPSDNNTSQRINSRAVPILKKEAIQAQSAQVNGISGASFTSQGFTMSLSSALSQAVQ